MRVCPTCGSDPRMLCLRCEERSRGSGPIVPGGNRPVADGASQTPAAAPVTLTGVLSILAIVVMMGALLALMLVVEP